MKLIRVAAASLNQTPLDWRGNIGRILAAIEQARTAGASLLCLPELCITGYGCEDAFFSAGVQQAALDALAQIAPATGGLAVSVGLPVLYQGQLYNAACVLADQRIRGFAAKHFLPGEGIHYEPRWFKPWPRGVQGELKAAGETHPIGDFIFEAGAVRIGFEICEDAWAALRPGSGFVQHGVDVVFNPSASHFAFGKFGIRKRFVCEGSRAFGVAYLYANLLGNESGRAIYDGGCLIAASGEIAACGRRFSYKDVDLLCTDVDLDKARLLRSRLPLAPRPEKESWKCVSFDFSLPEIAPSAAAVCSEPAWEHGPDLKEEEFARAVALGLFDYLRKSRMRGFVVSLSGGADSSAIACLVSLMVRLGAAELGLSGFCSKLSYISELAQCTSEQAIVQKLLTCVYQATRNSSERTKRSAAAVAQMIGAEFYSVDIDDLVEGYIALAEAALAEKLTWEKHDAALQNIQARVRSPFIWLIANVRSALLLATSNRSEAAVGYTTMDGDTSGGLSPIAGIDKAFLLHWLSWLERGGMHDAGALPALSHVTSQQPTAELRPADAGQTDEQDLMPYVVLDLVERLAIRDKKTPLEVFEILLAQRPDYSRQQAALWIERFFKLWSQNQWKRERYAPSFHLDDENLDPKTWCRFPILSGGFEREIEQLRQRAASAPSR